MQLKQVIAALLFNPVWSHPVIKGVVSFYLEASEMRAAPVFCQLQAVSSRDGDRFPKRYKALAAPWRWRSVQPHAPFLI